MTHKPHLPTKQVDRHHFSEGILLQYLWSIKWCAKAMQGSRATHQIRSSDVEWLPGDPVIISEGGGNTMPPPSTSTPTPTTRPSRPSYVYWAGSSLQTSTGSVEDFAKRPHHPRPDLEPPLLLQPCSYLSHFQCQHQAWSTHLWVGDINGHGSGQPHFFPYYLDRPI